MYTFILKIWGMCVRPIALFLLFKIQMKICMKPKKVGGGAWSRVMYIEILECFHGNKTEHWVRTLVTQRVKNLPAIWDLTCVWIPGFGRSPGEGNGNPLQYSCLENPMDRGAWWPRAHGVAERLSTAQRAQCDGLEPAFLAPKHLTIHDNSGILTNGTSYMYKIGSGFVPSRHACQGPEMFSFFPQLQRREQHWQLVDRG